MHDTLDGGTIPAKPTRWAKRAMVMLRCSILCCFVIIKVGSAILVSRLSVAVLAGAGVLLGLLVAIVSFRGLVFSVKAFVKPMEPGWLKYIAIVKQRPFIADFRNSYPCEYSEPVTISFLIELILREVWCGLSGTSDGPPAKSSMCRREVPLRQRRQNRQLSRQTDPGRNLR